MDDTITTTEELLVVIGSVEAIVGWSDDGHGHYAVETREAVFPVSEEVFAWAEEEHRCWYYESGAYLEPADD